MAKWFGKVGYNMGTVETEPGVWEEQYVEREYFGDVYRNTRLLQSSGGVNDNVNIANQISIVADPFADQNFHAIRYVEFMDANWKITNIEVQRPRLILTIGGVFNGDEITATE